MSGSGQSDRIPRTEAGRRFIDQWRYIVHAADVSALVVAIEDEARGAAPDRLPSVEALADIREQLERFAAIIEGRGEATLVAPHGMTSNGPRRALERLASLHEGTDR